MRDRQNLSFIAVPSSSRGTAVPVGAAWRALSALLVAGWLAWSPPAAGAGTIEPWTGGPTPPLTLKDLDGREWRLADFRGRVVLVNFWATWCAPCVAEMPSLQRLRDRLAPQGLEVLAVNFQENAARIRPFVERLEFTVPVLRDHDGSASRAWGVRVYPTTFIVGPDQRIVMVAIGEIDWADPAIVQRLRALTGASTTRSASTR
jgi:thiol-disulfide isomerase/thioredoxin